MNKLRTITTTTVFFQPSEQRRPQLDLALVPPTHPLEVVGRDPPVAVEGARNLAGDGPGGRKAACKLAKLEGNTAGAPDVFFLLPGHGGSHGFGVEFKSQFGRQSAAQRRAMQLMRASGYTYVIVRSVAQFMAALKVISMPANCSQPDRPYVAPIASTARTIT